MFLSMKLSGGSLTNGMPESSCDYIITPACSEGQCKKVIGEGMPFVDDPQKKGDLIIKFHVKFPKNLKPGQKSLIKQALYVHP